MQPTNAQSPWGHHDLAQQRSKQSRRLLEQLIVVVLLVTVGIMLAVWLPPLQRLLLDAEAPAARRGLDRYARSRGFAVGTTAATGHPRIRGGSLDPNNARRRFRFSHRPQLGQPQLGQPQLGQPKLGQPQLGQPQLGRPKPQPGGGEQRNADATVLGITRGDVALHQRASAKSPMVHRIKRGKAVAVVDSRGEWLLVVASPLGDHSDMVTGWVRRRAIALIR